MRFQHLLRGFLILLLVLLGRSALADTVRLDHLPSGPLGPHLLYLQEREGVPLNLEQARAALAQGAFRTQSNPVFSPGLSAPPTWIYLRLVNGLDDPIRVQLDVGMSWLDHVDVFQVQGGQVVARWHSGDEATALDGVVTVMPGRGFAFPLSVQPDLTEIFIRVESEGPMVLPVSMELQANASRSQAAVQYFYGLLYGYMAALMTYNIIVFLGVRKSSYLLYALHLSCFVGANLAYSGHGLAFLWPDSVFLQRYASYTLMVAWAISGIAFAWNFLEIGRTARLARRIAIGVCVLLGGTALASLVFDSSALAYRVAYLSVSAGVVAMLVFAVQALRREIASAIYFVAAASISLIGVSISLLADAGVLPFGDWTFRAADVALAIEATLLALALARDIRRFELARHEAELLARLDPLTGLLNRRAFIERAQGIWNTAARRGRPLTAAMIDIDHFKQVNDQYGHVAGDVVLKTLAGLLTGTCRTSDLISRWGGEEFLLLLPETTLEQAHVLAERLRVALENMTITSGSKSIKVTASIGMADLRGQPNLEVLIADADQWLYRAKHSGRNQVMGPPLAPPLPTIEVRESAFTMPTDL